MAAFDPSSSLVGDREFPHWLNQSLRWGWVARGVTYALSGVLAFSLVVTAFGRTEEPSQKGALRLIGEAPLGSVLLVALAAGLLLFPLWELVTVLTAQRDSLLTYLDHVGKIIGIGFYGLLAWSALQLGLGFGSSGGGATVNSLSKLVLSYPLGRIVMAAAGIIVTIIGVRRLRRAWTADFDDSLRTEEMGEDHEAMTNTLGRIGEAGRGLSFLLVGFFLALAGWQDQGAEAKGLDRLLYSLTSSNPGRIAVAIVGIGFFAYGLFSAASAKARRLPDERHAQ